MKVETVELNENLFSKGEYGKIFKSEECPGRGFTNPFIIIYPNKISDEKALLVLRDDNLESINDDLSKAITLSLTSERAVLVPITKNIGITEKSLINLITYGKEEIYECGELLSDSVILIGFDLEVNDDNILGNLDDEGLEVLTRNIDNLENSVPKM